ncbi:MAG: hypothetical protein D6790_21830 [Caldilineae bacterium]|nr:MAG: hypothetical protein D6790_21830 [Caldilineae bacterium]
MEALGKAAETVQKQYDALSTVLTKLPVPIPGEEPLLEEVRTKIYDRIKDVADTAVKGDEQTANMKLRDLLLDVTTSATSGTIARIAKSRAQYDEWVKQLNKMRQEGKAPDYVTFGAYQQQLSDFLKTGGSRKTTFTGIVPTQGVDIPKFMTDLLGKVEKDMVSQGYQPVTDKEGNLLGWQNVENEFISFDKLIENLTPALENEMARRGELPYLHTYLGLNDPEHMAETATTYAQRLREMASNGKLNSRYRQELRQRAGHLSSLARKATKGDKDAIAALQRDLMTGYLREVTAPYAGLKTMSRTKIDFKTVTKSGGSGDAPIDLGKVFSNPMMLQPYNARKGLSSGDGNDPRQELVKGLENSVVRDGNKTVGFMDKLTEQSKELVKENPEAYSGVYFLGPDWASYADPDAKRVIDGLKEAYAFDVKEVKQGEVIIQPGSLGRALSPVGIYIDNKTGQVAVPEFVTTKDGLQKIELPHSLVKNWQLTQGAEVVGYIPPADDNANLLTPTNAVVLSSPIGEDNSGFMVFPVSMNTMDMDTMLSATWKRMYSKNGVVAVEAGANSLFMMERTFDDGNKVEMVLHDLQSGKKYRAEAQYTDVQTDGGMYRFPMGWSIQPLEENEE